MKELTREKISMLLKGCDHVPQGLMTGSMKVEDFRALCSMALTYLDLKAWRPISEAPFLKASKEVCAVCHGNGFTVDSSYAHTTCGSCSGTGEGKP